MQCQCVFTKVISVTRDSQPQSWRTQHLHGRGKDSRNPSTTRRQSASLRSGWQVSGGIRAKT